MKAKTTKRLFILLSFVFTSFFVNAQQLEEGFVLQGHLISEHATQLNLSAEQQEQFEKLQITYNETLEKFYQEEESENVPSYEDFEKLNIQHSKDLKALLSKKQHAQLATILEMEKLEYEIQIREQQINYYKSGIWEVIALSDEQIKTIIDASEKLDQEAYVYNEYENDPQQMSIENIYQTVLTEEQYAIYLADIEVQKKEQIDKTITEMDQFLAPLEAIVLYFEEESFPKHQALRAKLDSKISAPDRIFIESIRAHFTRMFENTFTNEIRNGGPNHMNSPEIQSRTDRMINSTTKIMEMYTIPLFLTMIGQSMPHNDMPFDLEELKKLAENYNTDIEALSEETTALNQADFDKELEVFKLTFPETEALQLVKRINMLNENEDLMGPMDLDAKEVQLIKNLSFLLIPIEDKSLENNNNFTGKESFLVYPSPSKGQHTLELNLLTEDKVKVELLDHSGKVIQIAHNNTLPEGKHLLSFDWGHLEGSIFHYRIVGKHGVETVKFVISR